MNRFQDQVVLITGAAGGLGQEAARQFAAQGARLALTDVHADSLQTVAQALADAGTDVYWLAGDVRQEDQVKGFIDGCIAHYGRLDAAINNAGVDPDHHLMADIPLEDFQRTMDINVKGVFLCMKYQIPHMLNQGGGAICNIASVAGVGGAPYMSAYAASKHAVIGLTKSAAYEYGTRGIRINAVCPFITKTEMFEQTLRTMPDRELAEKKLTWSAALKRAAEPAEIVQGMLFACDKNNSYMTGHELVIDGGMTAI